MIIYVYISVVTLFVLLGEIPLYVDRVSVFFYFRLPNISHFLREQ